MAIMTHAKFHFNRLMLTLTFGIRASEPPPPPLRPGERLKRLGLIGLRKVDENVRFLEGIGEKIESNVEKRLFSQS